MSNANKTGRPSLSPVISNLESNKPNNKTIPIQITKYKNAYLSQPTLLSRSKVPKTSTPSSTTGSPTPTTSTLSSSASYAPNIINNQVINTINTTQNKNRNYASAAANVNHPSRDQALVFNSIDGIPQRDYIIAIGKIIPPKNIVFVSRISNNRFCIFLSTKQILDSLLEATQMITINEHVIQIRRLINPAKRIVISNVCPSIPNNVLLDALKNINVNPVSEISYLKAGINIEGYEHILSFRRQMYIKHEDTPNLPGSLSLLHNHTEFRVFFTDDKITCFLCKSTGHTSNTCKKTIVNPQTSTIYNPPDSVEEPPLDELTSFSPLPDNLETSVTPSPIKNPNISEHTPEQLEDIHIPELPPIDTPQPQSTMDWSQENVDKIPSSPIDNSIASHVTTVTPISTQVKRPLSDTNTLKSPTSPTTPDSPKPFIQPEKKKTKTSRSRSNSLTSTDDNKINTALQPSVAFFSDSEKTFITLDQFKYFLETLILIFTHYAMKLTPTLRTCLN